jgi:hypothetical protein
MKQEKSMNSDIEKFWGTLKTERDEMLIQAHLARAEFREEWNEVEEKCQKVEQKLSRIQNQAIATTDEMQSSVKVIME